MYTAWNQTRGSSLGTRVSTARTSRERREGLLKHETLSSGHGLWIAPCEAIHTFKMRFSIDIVFLDQKRAVVKMYSNVGPNRICFCFRAESVLELPAGTIAQSETQTRDRIEMRPCPTAL